jgi:hypothetical protein
MNFRTRPRHHWIVALSLAALSLAISVAVSLARWPQPQVHDEFSNLLLADTLSKGRLANPTHPHWQHFESFHIIQQPSYASKYPPGQGAVLALGQRLAGQPIAGVWLLTALATAACYWMLLGWAAPRWALLGGAMFAVHPGYQLMWGQSYWGGTLAFLGGALVLGAALRVRHRCRPIDACAMAAGALVLATSRPFEGAIFCLLVGAWVLIHWSRAGLPDSWRALALKTVAPQALILTAGAFALATYNQSVTGDPLKLPYKVHEDQYGQTPLFHGQPPQPRTYRHAVLEQFHTGWSMDWHRHQSTLAGWLQTKARMLRLAAAFFIPGLLAIPLIALLCRPKLWAAGRLRGPLIVGALTLLASLACLWNFPHYMAPLAPVLVLAIVAGLRYADVIGCRCLGRRPYAEALVGLQASLFLVAAINYATTTAGGWQVQRAAILAALEQTLDRHLVLVRYDEIHNTHQEWVYNRADIDSAKVVWARAMDDARDRELINYFADRKVWLLQPDQQRMQAVERASLEDTHNAPIASRQPSR